MHTSSISRPETLRAETETFEVRDRDRDRDIRVKSRDRDRDLKKRSRDGLETETWSRDLQHCWGVVTFNWTKAKAKTAKFVLNGCYSKFE